jgi:hypothetical protein
MPEMIPQGSVFGRGGSAFDLAPFLNNLSAKFELRTTLNGYGYRITTSNVLSTLVLMVYSLISLAYMLYSLVVSRTTSSAFQSMTEMLALTAKSAPSSALKNTGAGIATLGMLKKMVRIGVSDESLQMLVDESEGKGEGFEKEGVGRVVRNRYYM